MAVTVPNIPYKAKLLNDSGFLSQAWAGWFEEMAKRIGGPVALSNLELQTVRTSDIAALTLQLAALTSAVSALTTQVAGNLNDQRQGREL